MLLLTSSAPLAGGNMEGSAGWRGVGEGACRVVERAGVGWGTRSLTAAAAAVSPQH